MQLKWCVAILAVLLGALPALADDARAVALARFFSVYGSFHPSDGIPDAGGRGRLSLVLSDRLNKMIADAAVAEDHFRSRNRASPPLLEGDLFTSMFEGATSWKIGACDGDAAAAHCAVQLRHQEGQANPTVWTDTYYLTAIPGGWRVDDIAYGSSFAFGNTGRLSATLKSVMTQAK